jgi:hypothetical protein
MAIVEPFTRCWSGFATPAETFEDFNSFQNVSNGVTNPVTLQRKNQNKTSCLRGDNFLSFLQIFCT